MEILRPEQYSEYEAFVSASPYSCFTQSIKWAKVKNNWDSQVIVSRDQKGFIVGGLFVLIQKIPLFGYSLLYAPRGPVCDPHNGEVIGDLKAGVDELAKRYRGYLFKIDPDVLIEDETFISMMTGLGFTHLKGSTGFENIQARFNYRLYIEGRNEEQILAHISQKTRYNIRVAMKHGVEVKIVGKEALPDFVRLMQTTGERDRFNVRPISYFERMLGALGENVRLYMAYYEGKAISGAITTNYGGKTCYVYGASDNENRNVMPNYLVQWEMIKWAVQTGCIVYDFQGVSGNLTESDPLYGLYRFKKGFNGHLDELVGEFDYTYRPFAARSIDLAMDTKEKLVDLKRKIRH